MKTKKQTITMKTTLERSPFKLCGKYGIELRNLSIAIIPGPEKHDILHWANVGYNQALDDIEARSILVREHLGI